MFPTALEPWVDISLQYPDLTPSHADYAKMAWQRADGSVKYFYINPSDGLVAYPRATASW
jgi:hypothetical protein